MPPALLITLERQPDIEAYFSLHNRYCFCQIQNKFLQTSIFYGYNCHNSKICFNFKISFEQLQRSGTPSKADHEHILGSPSRDHSRMGLHDDDDLGMEDGDDIDEQLHGSYLGNEDMGESKFNRRMHYLFLLICTKEH